MIRLSTAMVRFRRVLRRVFASIGAACLLGACGNGGPSLAPLADDAVILAFGDSLTYGTGADRGESYPDYLAARTGLTVINAGIPGELSSEGLDRLPSLLTRHAPDLVILWHGGNDILRNRDPGRTEDNLREMVRRVRDARADVLLLSVPEKSLFLGAAPFYQRVADDLGIVLLDDLLPEILRDPELKSDGVHPNGAGYEMVAEKISEILN